MAARGENATYVELFCEFLEVLIHQVLFLRDLYPKNIFVDRKKFGVPVKMSSHPWVNDYITKTVESVSNALKKPDTDIDSVVIVVAEQARPVERYLVEMERCSLQKSLGLGDEFLVQLEMSFVSFLLRLTQAAGNLSRPHSDSRWWLEMGTTQRGALRLSSSLEWCLASSPTPSNDTPPGHASIVPVMAVNSPIKFQLYIEKMS